MRNGFVSCLKREQNEMELKQERFEWYRYRAKTLPVPDYAYSLCGDEGRDVLMLFPDPDDLRLRSGEDAPRDITLDEARRINDALRNRRPAFAGATVE